MAYLLIPCCSEGLMIPTPIEPQGWYYIAVPVPFRGSEVERACSPLLLLLPLSLLLHPPTCRVWPSNSCQLPRAVIQALMDHPCVLFSFPWKWIRHVVPSITGQALFM